jgi:hypothetical protein
VLVPNGLNLSCPAHLQHSVLIILIEEPEKLYLEDFDDGWTFLGRKRVG